MLIGGEVGSGSANQMAARNPDRPHNVIAGPVRDDDSSGPTKTVTRMTSPEKWEIQQVHTYIVSSGCRTLDFLPLQVPHLNILTQCVVTCICIM